MGEAAVTQSPASVRANVNYARSPGKQHDHVWTAVQDQPENLPAESKLQRELHEVTIHNLAHPDSKLKPSLKEHGFVVAPFKVPKGIDWNDEESIKRLYWPALEELIKRETKASRVLVFDHTQRKGNVRDGTEQDLQKYDDQGRRQPVSLAHVDYDLKSGIDRLKAWVPEEEAARLQQTPFAVIQVWRPTQPVVDASPLAMIDASSIAKKDLIPLAIYFPGRQGWNFAITYNPVHKWYYHKGITEEEAYVFVCYDSRAGRARFTPHTGFKDPSTASDAPERESVEARAYAFWEHEEPAAPERELDPTNTFHKPDLLKEE